MIILLGLPWYHHPNSGMLTVPLALNVAVAVGVDEDIPAGLVNFDGSGPRKVKIKNQKGNGQLESYSPYCCCCSP